MKKYPTMLKLLWNYFIAEYLWHCCCKIWWWMTFFVHHYITEQLRWTSTSQSKEFLWAYFFRAISCVLCMIDNLLVCYDVSASSEFFCAVTETNINGYYRCCYERKLKTYPIRLQDRKYSYANLCYNFEMNRWILARIIMNTVLLSLCFTMKDDTKKEIDTKVATQSQSVGYYKTNWLENVFIFAPWNVKNWTMSHGKE